MNTSLYDSGAYRRSRVAYIVQCALEYIVQLLVLDTFLAKLLTSLGVADAAVGVISSVLSFTCLIQLVSVPLLRNMRSVKRVVILTDCASMLLYVGLYLLPAMGLGSRAGTVMALVLVAGGSLLRSFSFSVYYQWAISFVDPAKRGKFTAKKEMVSLATAIVMTLAAGALVDRFEAGGNIVGSFRILAGVILTLTAMNLVSLLLMQDNTEVCRPRGTGHRSVMLSLLRSRAFRAVALMEMLEQMAEGLTMGFLGTYKTIELGFTVWTVQLFSTAANLGRMGLSLPIGRYSDRRSYTNGYRMGLGLMLAAFVVLSFTSPARRWLMAAFMVLYSVSYAAIGGNSANVLFSYVPYSSFSAAYSLVRSVNGVIYFFSALLGSAILRAVSGGGNRLFGLPVYAQQVLAFGSAVLLLLSLLQNRLVVSRQPRHAAETV